MDDYGQAAGVSLRKDPAPGTWRHLGLCAPWIDPHDVPIGGRDRADIERHLDAGAEPVGRTALRNAFVVRWRGLRLLYVRRGYGRYHSAARHLFSPCAWAIDYDHALGSALAKRLGYEWILLLRVVPRVNRSHGRCETPARLTEPATDPLAFANGRIVDKWLGRIPGLLRGSAERLAAFTAEPLRDRGLTLKQRGKWAFALGLEWD